MKNTIYISVQDYTGDSKLKLKWSKNDEKARKEAREEFIRLQNAGYRIFSVKKVLGIFNTPGEEIKEYDPSSGVMYYEKGEENKKSFTMEKVEEDNIEYEDPVLFNPKEDDVDAERNYVATKPLRAG